VAAAVVAVIEGLPRHLPDAVRRAEVDRRVASPRQIAERLRAAGR
jgi:uncharacterized protein YjeT (DUF2065 family)